VVNPALTNKQMPHCQQSVRLNIEFAELALMQYNNYCSSHLTPSRFTTYGWPRQIR